MFSYARCDGWLAGDASSRCLGREVAGELNHDGTKGTKEFKCGCR
jgi:hypothetical protein